MRNDLGRVSEFGSVRAEAPRIEGHRGVWHMVSTVAGRLRDGTTDADLLRATFPPGSVTGAPKVQSMKVIAALEPHARHAFSGAIGFASPLAGLDLSVAIRTFETSGNDIWLDVGGGIVADSTPEAELREVRAKAAGPIAAIGGELDLPDAAPSELPPLPRALAFGDRPDPTRGVFTTILIEDGEPVDLDAHLERLGVVKNWGQTPTFHRARMRVTFDGETVGVTVTDEKSGSGPVVSLRPVMLPGGLGAHKWIDRDLLSALADAFPGEVTLLVDADGDVLEAAYANVWLKTDDGWLTPPADGRILPGITRARLLRELPGAREQRLTLDDLRGGNVHLSSSIRGLHQATLADPARALTGPFQV
jgi:para-aminobenzoate synthetase/4-amino-4-deoxychorismate lyase